MLVSMVSQCSRAPDLPSLAGRHYHRSYQLLGFEEIGVEIESPFGTDDNDIDLDAIVRDICVDMQARRAPTVHNACTVRGLLQACRSRGERGELHSAY